MFLRLDCYCWRAARLGLLTLVYGLIPFASSEAIAATPSDHPNILWLVCEDANVNWFGCYGNAQARTPNIDALAREGFRYTHAYASAPVCAAQRSAWITGINSIAMGTHPMRSRYAIPHKRISYYPDMLRKAGYYTANHTKTDYNIGGRRDTDCWDSKSKYGWNERQSDQPFFQVINFTQSHESRAQGSVADTRHSPDSVRLRKYHPNEPDIRRNYAKYHDAVQNMDNAVGEALQKLEDDGLADDTIVIFCSDHGGVMPRSKRFLFNSGIHCPLIVRLPDRFRSHWPAEKPGTAVDRLVSFLDFPKTWLSLADAPIPPLMQGRIFLGDDAEAEPPFVLSFRGRMDERFDNQRSVRDKRFVYIKNYLPFAPWGQRLDYLWRMKATQAWEAAHLAGRTDAVSGRFFTNKPTEELYDTHADPDNVVNLADKPEHQQTLVAMRAALRRWQLAQHDTALLPEGERVRRAGAVSLTIYEMVRDPQHYDLPAYLDAADLALATNAENLSSLKKLLVSKDSGLRYWGAVGLMRLGKLDADTQQALQLAKFDSCGEAAAMAAWALQRSGDAASANEAMLGLLDREEETTRLFALNVIDWAEFDSAALRATIQELAQSKSTSKYVKRMAITLNEKFLTITSK